VAPQFAPDLYFVLSRNVVYSSNQVAGLAGEPENGKCLAAQAPVEAIAPVRT
jgi:hypothetical protein